MKAGMSLCGEAVPALEDEFPDLVALKKISVCLSHYSLVSVIHR